MKSVPYGRIVFGSSAVLFGVIALMWHDSDTWQTLSQIWKLPLGSGIGAFLMVVQIAGGLGLHYPRTTHFASIVLVGVYLLFSLACVPGILAAPTVYVHYGSFFEQFSLLCGSIALYAATDAKAARVARLGLGVCAISFTLSQVFYFRLTAGLVPRWIPPGQTFWAAFTTVAFALAALALLLDREARLAARLLTLMLALFGVLVWIPLLVAHPQAHSGWSEFALTSLITGAAWAVADSLAANV